MQSKVYNFLIIGNGDVVNKHHLPAISRLGGKVLKIVDSKEDYKLNLNDERVDVVVIATPNYLHVPMAIDALNAGKKVILEKPIATTLADARLLIDHPLSDNVAVCYQRRFNTECKQIKKNAKGIIRVNAEVLVRRDKAYWNTWRADKQKSGGGSLINIGIHYLDLLIWWLGDTYEVTFAKSAEREGTDQVVYAEMNFNGIPVTFLESAIHSKRDITMNTPLKSIAYYTNLGEVGMDRLDATYSVDDATHFDVYDQFLNHNNYIGVKDAYKSLELVHKIYEAAII